MAQVRDDCQEGNELAAANQTQSEKGSATHASFRVVQEPVNSGISKLGGNLLHQEKVRVKPAWNHIEVSRRDLEW